MGNNNEILMLEQNWLHNLFSLFLHCWKFTYPQHPLTLVICHMICKDASGTCFQ